MKSLKQSERLTEQINGQNIQTDGTYIHTYMDGTNKRTEQTNKQINTQTTHRHTTVLRPFFWDQPGEPVPEENFWTLWCKGKLMEADTPTIRLGATASGLTSAHLHHPHPHKQTNTQTSHMYSKPLPHDMLQWLLVPRWTISTTTELRLYVPLNTKTGHFRDILGSEETKLNT